MLVSRSRGTCLIVRIRSTFPYLDHHVHHSGVVGLDDRGSLPTRAVRVAATTVAVAFVRDDKGGGNLVALGAVVSA